MGLKLRAVGKNAAAALHAGIGVKRTLMSAALISGALAGLAGVSEVAGLLSYLTTDLSPGYGYTGIVVAMLAGLSSLGVVVAALFIASVFTAGAMPGWMAVWLGAGLCTGLLCAALTGAFFGLIHAILTVPLGLSQYVSGLGITMSATSVSYFTYRTALPQVSSPPRIEPFQPLDILILSDIPFLGPVLFQQTAMTWLALVLVALVWWVYNRTPLGQALRAVGDNPNVVDAQGLSVYGLRMGAIVAGSACMALGGVFLTMSAFDAFFFGMVNGRGWICIALVIFASWRLEKALLEALLTPWFKGQR